MSPSEIFNAPWMWIYVAVLLAVAVLQALIFMRRGWKRALALGLSPAQVKKGLTTGITISILPTLPVLIVFLSLIPLLGTPLPWLRLSVIGSAFYESLAASIGVESVGEQLVLGGFTANGWIAAAWVMTVGGSASVLWSMCANKPVSMAYEQAGKKDVGLTLALGTGCMTGAMAYISVIQGWSDVSGKGVVFTISFLVGVILVLIQKKAKVKWLSDYIMTISMLVAMVAACFIFK